MQAQFVKNGSFEEHKDGMYPIGLTGADSYPNNQLMKCIGFCDHINVWTPLDGGCHNSSFFGGGWYWVSKHASPDYFHIAGIGDAKSPNINVTFIPYEFQKRYPYGYTPTEKNDSAFIGIRIWAADSTWTYGLDNYPNYNSYKEYVQSKLNTPLTGPAEIGRASCRERV